MSANIANASGGLWRNDSEYAYDLGKLAHRPSTLEEMDGYRERGKSSDYQTTRVYKCAWSQRIAAQEWLVGHSRSVLNDLVDTSLVADSFTFNQDLSDVDDDAPTVARIVREIPAQDPERPWLFCDEVELERGQGAWVVSPFVVARDADGNPVPGAPPLDAIHYVGNDKAGNVGYLGTADEDVGEGAEVETPPTGAFSDGVAILRATFRPRDYTVLTDDGLIAAGGGELRRYVRRTEEMALEALPLAKLANAGLILKFAEGPSSSPSVIGQPVPEAGVQQYPLKNLTYEWVDVPDLPRGAHARCVGRINADEFDGFRGFPQYPKHTLLCLPWKYRQTTSITGRITWQVQFRFVFRPQKWNYFPAGDGNFYLATFGGGAAGETVYKEADFDELFIPPAPQSYMG